MGRRAWEIPAIAFHAPRPTSHAPRPRTRSSSVLTLAIIKPDAVAAGKAGKILAHLEGQGFRVKALRMVKLTTAQAQAFYEVHRERPFYGSLVTFMTSGACIP